MRRARPGQDATAGKKTKILQEEKNRSPHDALSLASASGAIAVFVFQIWAETSVREECGLTS